MSSDAPSPESVQDIQVRLKPIFGVEPKYYLAGLYAVAALVLLFLVLFYPGLANPGSRVTITSTPPGAAVTFGTKHWGTTPLTVFLPEGKDTLVIERPGFNAERRDYTSGNSLFASLLLPRTDKIEVALKPSSDTSVADLARQDIGRWAMAAPFTSEYRFPPLFTLFASDAAAAGWEPDRIRTFLLSLRSAVADPQMYLDYGRALKLWGAEAPAPEGMETQFKLWEPVVGAGAGAGRLALWLLANQTKPVRDREVAEQSDWFRARLQDVTGTLKPSAATTTAPAAIKTAFGSFRGIPASSFLWGSDGATFSLPTEPPFVVPVPVSTAAFWIADREVTNAEFAAFTTAVPQWSASGRDALVAAGLADGDYLSGAATRTAADPVASVSWYAAQAYVDWLNQGRVPAGKKAILPDDYQWEAAARSAGGANMLNQGVWEWTASAWYPGQALVWTGAEPVRDAIAYAHSLKGGVQSPKGSIKAGDRAGWPSAGTTPGLGFRVALVGTP